MTNSDYDPRAERGEWKLLPYKSQIESVHMALLHTGKVLYFSGFRVAEAVKTETRVLYPRTGRIGAPPTPGDIFCAGHSFLPDGRLLTTGGTLEYRDLPPLPPWLVRALRPIAPFIVRAFGRFAKTMTMTGPTFLHLFDPKTEQWTFAGEMEEGRWYPTNTTLPDGRILILSGSNEGGGFGSKGRIDVNRRIEVYSAEDGLQQVAIIPSTDPHFPTLYPRMFVLPLSDEEKRAYPAGKAFCAGEHALSKFLSLSTWEWTDVAELEFGARHAGCALLLPLRPPDYRARVLTFGGLKEHDRDAIATETAELMDLSRQPYGWEKIDSLQDKRSHACAVLLPDGRVLAVGGNRRGLFDDPVLNVQVFEPEERRWRQVAPMSVARAYHSTALLLPDGRVLTAGTTPYGPYELRLEVYSPDYLFKGPRPRIITSPKSLAYGQPAEVGYEYAGNIRSVVLMRPGAVTHAFDMDQRCVELRFNRDGTDRLAVEAPPDPHVAPPGFYMLFLLNEDGVPSEAKFVHLPIQK